MAAGFKVFSFCMNKKFQECFLAKGFSFSGNFGRMTQNLVIDCPYWIFFLQICENII